MDFLGAISGPHMVCDGNCAADIVLAVLVCKELLQLKFQALVTF